MKKTHLTTGLIMVLIFVVSGLYLKFTLPPFDGNLDGNRMMYRASHVYLMMAAAVNVMAGIYFHAFKALLASRLQKLRSSLVILSQPILLLAFAIEPARNVVERFFTLIGAVCLLFGVFFIFLGWWYQIYTNKNT